MKSLKEFCENMTINEARQITYRVQLLDVVDKEGIGISADIMIDKANQSSFEEWLEDQADNLFIHADGGNVEY
jgi:hypothetical protein